MRGFPADLRSWLFRLAAAAVLLLLLPAAARAGPPFETDDPEPVGLHHWELYIASQSEASGDDTSGTAPHVELNYGPTRNLQLHVIVPLAYDRPEGGPTTLGLGDVELGAKLRFVQEGPHRPMVGIFPLAELPTGEASRGLGSGHTRLFLPLWLQKSFGAWTTYGGAGYRVNPGAGNRDSWFTGWLLERRLPHGVTLGGELFHETADTEGGRGDTRFNAGLQVDFTDHHHLLLSAGRSLDGDTRFATYAAYQRTW